MDLSGFTALESIGLSAEMLFAPDERNVIPVQEQLPASIRHLSIEYGFEEPVRYARDSLATLGIPNRKRSPYLKEIQIHIAHYSRAVRIANDMKVRSNQDLCVEYSIHSASFGITFHPTVTGRSAAQRFLLVFVWIIERIPAVTLASVSMISWTGSYVNKAFWTGATVPVANSGLAKKRSKTPILR